MGNIEAKLSKAKAAMVKILMGSNAQPLPQTTYFGQGLITQV